LDKDMLVEPVAVPMVGVLRVVVVPVELVVVIPVAHRDFREAQV
jgi:hypothetical protein